ncbi:hypothetical protein GCM10027300_29190 [Modestobacter lapidis]|nr:hypothetical protein [Modestobacter lapidis]
MGTCTSACRWPPVRIALGGKTLRASVWYGPWLLLMFVLTGVGMVLGVAAPGVVRQPKVVGAVTFSCCSWP